MTHQPNALKVPKAGDVEPTSVDERIRIFMSRKAIEGIPKSVEELGN